MFEFWRHIIEFVSYIFEFWRQIFEFWRQIFEFWHQKLKIDSFRMVMGGGSPTTSGRFRHRCREQIFRAPLGQGVDVLLIQSGRFLVNHLFEFGVKYLNFSATCLSFGALYLNFGAKYWAPYI